MLLCLRVKSEKRLTIGQRYPDKIGKCQSYASGVYEIVAMRVFGFMRQPVFFVGKIIDVHNCSRCLRALVALSKWPPDFIRGTRPDAREMA